MNPIDGCCRSCSGQVQIIDADDARMTVECRCADVYFVEPDAFGDGCITSASRRTGGARWQTSLRQSPDRTALFTAVLEFLSQEIAQREQLARQRRPAEDRAKVPSFIRSAGARSILIWTCGSGIRSFANAPMVQCIGSWIAPNAIPEIVAASYHARGRFSG